LEFEEPEADAGPPAADVAEPRIDEPSWTDFVLAKLTPEEFRDGNPKVDGLRRVASELLGDIIENSSEVLQAPTAANGFFATVRARVVILWKKDCYGDPGPRVFTGLADVYPGNTEPAFGRFPSSVAETRAEGRALRKALQLRRVVAA